jgi:hypothetical protein
MERGGKGDERYSELRIRDDHVRRVVVRNNGSPERIESSFHRILVPRRTVAVSAYYRVDGIADAGVGGSCPRWTGSTLE